MSPRPNSRLGAAKPKIRILIAGDHALFRHGMRSLVESSGGDFVVVAEAKDGLDAIVNAVELQPDRVPMQLCMPNRGGVESIVANKRRAPHTRIVVVTGHCTEKHVRATLEAGADGYVLGDDTGEDLLKALRTPQEGKIILSPGICGPLITGYLHRPSPGEAPGAGRRHPPTAPARQAQTSWLQLTTRERQMFKRVAEGKTSREIATIPNLSAKTGEKHRANLMRKMSFGNVSELVAYARDNGLI